MFYLEKRKSVACNMFVKLVIGVHSSFATISSRKKELVALLMFSLVAVSVQLLYLFLSVLWVGLQCVIGAFPHDLVILTYLFSDILNLDLLKNITEWKSLMIFCIHFIHIHHYPSLISVHLVKWFYIIVVVWYKTILRHKLELKWINYLNFYTHLLLMIIITTYMKVMFLNFQFLLLRKCSKESPCMRKNGISKPKIDNRHVL